jgi:hypothetical protein
VGSAVKAAKITIDAKRQDLNEVWMKISASKPALNQHSQKLSTSKTIIMNVYNIKSSQSKIVVFPDTELIRLT